MSGISYTNLRTKIRDYTEVSSTVLSDTIIEGIVLDAEYRIYRDVPIDAYRDIQVTAFTTNQDFLNSPAGAHVVRAVQVFDATSGSTGANKYLIKKDVTFLEEYISANTSTGQPKYYAMGQGGTGDGATNSGKIRVVPVPDAAYVAQIHFTKIPDKLEASSNETSYISLNFPNGLLYACLVEAFGFLKGPPDMIQYYERRYQTEIQKFGGEQIGQRRRDDYTDGTIRIPVNSPTP
jgi:hypothetical protein